MYRHLIFGILLLGMPVAAQGVNGGLQVGLNFPYGDLNDKKYDGVNKGLGLHFGGHLDFNATPHHQIRLHLTSNGFGGDKWGAANDRENRYGIAQLGADYVYNFTNPSKGAFFLAGLHVNRVRRETESRISREISTTQNGRLGLKIGGGYNFTRWFSLEGSLNGVNVEKSGSDGFGFDSATWLAVSTVFRFGGRN